MLNFYLKDNISVYFMEDYDIVYFFEFFLRLIFLIF